MNWIRKILGITELIKQQEKTNELLTEISRNTKNASNYLERWIKAHHL